MARPDYQTIVIALVLVAACGVVALVEYRRTRELLSPLMLFLGLAVVDVFLPAALYAATRPASMPPWLSVELVDSQLRNAVITFAIGASLFCVGYVVAHVSSSGVRINSVADKVVLLRARAYIVLAIAGVWWLWSLWYRAGGAGFFDYIRSGLLIRWDAEPMAAQFPTASYPIVLALQVAPTMLTLFTMMTAIIFFQRRSVFGIEAVVMPALALLASALTFFRGSILIYFMSLAALIETRQVGMSGLTLSTTLRKHVHSAAAIALGVVMFFGFGVVRNTFQIAALREYEASVATASPAATTIPVVTATTRVVTPPSGTPYVTTVPTVTTVPSTASSSDIPTVTTSPIVVTPPDGTPYVTSVPIITTEPRSPNPASTPIPVVGVSNEGVTTEVGRLLRGEGLLGLAAILAYYPAEHPYFGGKTIHDTLLLPVPRAIWKDKPDWYGVSDITRALGEPSSTQSAVTMPGELYANFGPIGLIGMLAYGFTFGLFHRLRRRERFSGMYAFVLLPMMFVTFWMGMTGFVNAILAVIPAVLAVYLVHRPATNESARAPHA